jgi:glycerol-3-phosphate dehydrogenase (NAD(P)+)
MGRPIVGVIGGGAWGIALAVAAARAGSTTLLLSRRPPPSLPEGIRLVQSDAEIGELARLIVLAVPSAVTRGIARSLGAHLDGRHFVVHGVRGLVPRDGDGSDERGHDLETISDIVRDETPARRVGALGGPAVASDLVAGRPSVMVCGSRYPEVTHAFHEAFSTPALRIYGTHDLLGLEWASALVGCLAICVGYARGVGLGPGLLAAVITRAVEEGARLASAAGGEERTLLGLAGYGDLLASISQAERPEVLVGEALARGKTLERALADAGQRVEAVELTARVVDWAAARDVKAPIFAALAGGILSGDGDALVRELMTG